MRKLFSQAALSLLIQSALLPVFAGEMGSASQITPGFYGGIGGSGISMDETYNSTFRTVIQDGAIDSYNTNQTRLAPMAQAGYWRPFRDHWLWGMAVQWEYLGYKTANVNSNHGQYLPNASFSSINIFGPDIIRNFDSQTKVNNEARLLLYAGQQLKKGYVYLGLGPALFNATNYVFVSSVHTSNGGDTLISNSVSSSRTLWGGAAQLGYNHYIDPTLFLNVSYTYSQSGAYSFNNEVNTALLNGANSPGPNYVNLNRTINLEVQGVTLSVNKVFEI